MAYNVFTRTWWRKKPNSNILEPHLGHKRYLAKNVETAAECVAMCRRYNDNTPPGRLSRKAEFEEVDT